MDMGQAIQGKAPWYVKCLETILSKEGIVAVFAMVLLGMFVLFMWMDRKERQATHKQNIEDRKALAKTAEASQEREERNTKAFEGLTEAFKTIVETQRATQDSLEELADRAKIMELVPAQRQQHHDEEMEVLQEIVSSSKTLQGTLAEKVPAEHQKMLNNQDTILKKLE